jgi:glycosyltransferase involved in cell wall biosynthesis
MRNITVLINYLGKKGGGSAYAYEMAKTFLKNDINVIAIIPSDIENLHLWRLLTNIHLIEIKSYSNVLGFILATIRIYFSKKKIVRLVNDVGIVDYIYIPMEQPLTKLINSFFPNIKYILTVHDLKPHTGDQNLIHFITKFLNLNLRKNAHRVIVLSSQFVTPYTNKYKISQSKIWVIKHGVFTYYADGECKTYHLDNQSETNFIFFGRIADYKGIDILLKAYKIVSGINQKTSLSIIGNGDLRKYENEINSLPRVNVINRWIKDEEIKNFFTIKNSVVIVPYKNATQSGVISVANLFNVPVIGSNVGGLSEQIDNGITGFLYNNNSYIELSEIMLLMTDEKLRNKISENAYTKIINTWEECAKHIHQLYIEEYLRSQGNDKNCTTDS